MGAKSYCEITREDAIQAIMKHILEASSNELEDRMNAIFGDKKLLHFGIVSQYSEKNEDDKMSYPYRWTEMNY